MQEITTAINNLLTILGSEINIINIAIIISFIISSSVILYLGYWGIKKLIYTVLNTAKGKSLSTSISSDEKKSSYKSEDGKYTYNVVYVNSKDTNGRNNWSKDKKEAYKRYMYWRNKPRFKLS